MEFDELSPGSIVSELYTPEGVPPILIAGYESSRAGVNLAQVFDSESPPSSDLDLGTPNSLFGGRGEGAGGYGQYYNA